MREEGAVEMRTLEGEREKEKDDVEMKKKSTRLGGEKGQPLCHLRDISPFRGDKSSPTRRPRVTPSPSKRGRASPFSKGEAPPQAVVGVPVTVKTRRSKRDKEKELFPKGAYYSRT